MNLIDFFKVLACIFGVLFVGGLVESFLLLAFPAQYPNVLREDGKR